MEKEPRSGKTAIFGLAVSERTALNQSVLTEGFLQDPAVWSLLSAQRLSMADPGGHTPTSPGSQTRSSPGTLQRLGCRGKKVDQADLVSLGFVTC